MVPKNADPNTVACKGQVASRTIHEEIPIQAIITPIACSLVIFPATIGKYGLFTLSISISVIWFKPVI